MAKTTKKTTAVRNTAIKSNNGNNAQNIVPATKSAVIITATPSQFFTGKHRTKRLVEALKPITDIWYDRFMVAAKDNGESVIREWNNYHHEYFQTMEHPEDEIFRYAAIMVILSTIRTESFFKSCGITTECRTIIDLILADERKQVTYWYPEQRFYEEYQIYQMARNIDNIDIR